MRAAIALAAIVGIAGTARAAPSAIQHWWDHATADRDYLESVLDTASDPQLVPEIRARRARECIAPLKQLLRRHPDDPSLHLMLSDAWRLAATTADPDHSDPESVVRAIEELRRARALAPSGAWELEIAEGLADLEGRLGHFATSVEEYRRAIDTYRQVARVAHHPDDVITDDLVAGAEYNLADNLAALGRLDEAIAAYRLAIAEQTSRRTLPALPYWGLAAALDRRGDSGEARAVMRHGLDLDKGQESLRKPGVYFVPAAERYYYYAMAAELDGDRERAATYYRRYVDEAKASPWRDRAREHLAELGAAGVRIDVRRSDGVATDLSRPVREVVARDGAKLRACLEPAPRLVARLVLEVHGDGHARVVEPSGGAAGPEACAASLARGWRFPVAAAGTVVVSLSLAD